MEFPGFADLDKTPLLVRLLKLCGPRKKEEEVTGDLLENPHPNQ